MSIETKKLIGEADASQIENWKKEKENANGIYALKNKSGHIAYFRKPNRHEMNCAMSKADSKAALAMYEELARLTWLGGSEELLNNDGMFYGITLQLKEMMEGDQAELVNL